MGKLTTNEADRLRRLHADDTPHELMALAMGWTIDRVRDALKTLGLCND